MTTTTLIDELKKVVYVAGLKKLEKKHINTIKRAILILTNYERATKLYLEADKK